LGLLNYCGGRRASFSGYQMWTRIRLSHKVSTFNYLSISPSEGGQMLHNEISKKVNS
jgi:hypothetical protein